MTFKKAKKKLKKLAGGRYFSIRQEDIVFSNGDKKTECSIYIDGYEWTFNKETFEEALWGMKERIKEGASCT